MVPHVRVLFHATFREAVGQREMLEEIDSGSTVGDLLNKLARRYGGDFDDIINSERGEISREVVVMVNGKSVRKTNVVLREGDVVMITVPFGGG
ncbi:MAG: MoaD/ThiS family protein [Candidatus Bathyarchaeia archaeon]